MLPRKLSVALLQHLEDFLRQIRAFHVLVADRHQDRRSDSCNRARGANRPSP